MAAGVDLVAWAEQLAPPGVNPFEFAASYYRRFHTFINPPMWYAANSVVLVVLLLVASALHLLAVVLPLFLGKESRRMHLWLARKKHVEGKKGYWIPNGRLFSTIFSLSSAVVLAVIYAVTLWAPRLFSGSIFGIVLNFLFLQYWLCAFDILFADALCALWLSPNPSRTLRRPRFLNTLCWVIPSVAVTWQFVVIVVAGVKATSFHYAGDRALAELDLAAAEYDRAGRLDQVSELAAVYEDTLAMSRALDKYLMWAIVLYGGLGGCFLVCASLFGFSLVLLVRLVRKTASQDSFGRVSLASPEPVLVLETQTAVVCLEPPEPVASRTPMSPTTSSSTTTDVTITCPGAEWQVPPEWNSLALGRAKIRSRDEPGRSDQRGLSTWIRRLSQHLPSIQRRRCYGGPKERRQKKEARLWGKKSLAGFLSVHMCLIIWLTASNFVVCAQLRQSTRNLQLYRGIILGVSWPTILTLFLMGVLGVASPPYPPRHRIRLTLSRVQSRILSTSRRPSGRPTSSILDVQPTFSFPTTEPPPRPTPPRKGSSYVGLFALDEDDDDGEKVGDANGARAREGFEAFEAMVGPPRGKV